MSEIDFGKYKFIDYTDLGQEESEIILSERNMVKVRQWMNNNNLISWEEHVSFLKSLKTDDEKKYWLVIRNAVPIGAVYIVDINLKHQKGVWGYYLFEKYQGTGWGIDVEFYSLSIFFDYLELTCVTGYVHKKNTNSLTLQPIFNFRTTGENDNQIILSLNKEDYDRLPKDLKEFKINKILNNGNIKINS